MTESALFENIFRTHYVSLCREANFYLGDKDEAEDLVQELFISLWEEKRDSLNILKKAYFTTAVRNRCISKLRKKNKNFSIEEPSIFIEANNNSSEENNSELIEKAENLNDALKQILPEKCRLIFYACKVDGKSYAEVALSLGISVKTVENQMGKALKLIRQLVKERPDLALLFLTFFLN